MFHSIQLTPIEFKSNPPLDPRPAVDYTSREDGSPVNKFVMQSRDNKGLVGAHYDPSIMSLRARLNRGVQLQKVGYGVIENDPNVITKKVRQTVAAIDASKSARQAAVQQQQSIVEPSNP